jgi:hypothetical protein
MRRQLGTQHPFHQLDLQLFHQPGVAKQIFRKVRRSATVSNGSNFGDNTGPNLSDNQQF